jgi:hypothetical protein
MSAPSARINFRHPFKDRNLLVNNPQIFALFKQRAGLIPLYERMRDIPETLTTADLETVLKWYDDVKAFEAKVEQQELDGVSVLQKKKGELAIKIDKSTEINEATTQALKDGREGEARQLQLIEQADRQFETSLAKYRAVRGDAVTRDLIIAAFGNDILTPAQISSTQPSGEIPIQIIEACRTSLPNGESVGQWTTPKICQLIKGAGDHIEQIQLQLDAARQIQLPNDTISQLTECVRQSSLVPTSPHKPQALSSTIPRPTNPKSISLSTTRESSGTVSDDENGFDYVPREMYDAAENDKLDLDLQLEDAQQKIASLSAENIRLKASLVHNYQYDKQSKASIIHQCCQDFRDRLPEEIFNLPPYFQPRPILYLADNFDNKPLRPSQPYSICYLYSLLEDIRIDANLEVDTVLQAEQASRYVQQHIPWLGTTVNNILKSGSDQEIQMLIRYLNVVVLNFPPSGLARACLFLIVAGLVHQCPEMRNTLWLLLYGKVVAHAFGNPERDWDLLDILSFARFLSVGSPASLEGVFDDVSSQAFIKRLVFRLRSSPPTNFLNLLEHTAVKDFMSECAHNANAQSELVITSRTKGEQMFIMRTSSGLDGIHQKEYIWVKSKSGITLLDQGLKFLMDLQSGILLMGVMPISTTNMPLFTIKDDDPVFQDYMNRCHEDDILRASQEYCKRTGSLLPI